MADTKFSALGSLTSAASANNDVIPIVDVSVPSSLKITLAELALAMVNYGALLTTAAATAGYQPLDADLTAIAALTTTATGRSLLATADAAAIRVIAASAPLNQTINAQTGTTYTFVLGDNGGFTTLSNAAAITATVPLNASVAYPVGARLDLAQIGAGQVTVTPTGGVTINGTPGLKTRAQYSGASLIKTATDTWLAVGDLSA